MKIVLIVAGIVLVIFPLIYSYKYDLDNNPKMAAFEMRAKVAKLVDYKEEARVGIIVADPSQDKAFYKDAKIGDVLLLYPRANKAILYDPDVNRIIKTGEYRERL